LVLRDVAGMIRSFHYVASGAMYGQIPGITVRPERLAALESWGQAWYMSVSAAFLNAYLAAAGQASFLPRAREELKILLDALLLEKALYEIAYELNNRPDWVRIPLRGILDLMEVGDDGRSKQHPDQ
jgi:maltose alpha-D-glucosyltransferase/alpha-amylase